MGERVVVEADIYADGHDTIACRRLRYRKANASEWNETPMQPLGNDRWRSSFTVTALGRHHYTVMGWADLSRPGDLLSDADYLWHGARNYVELDPKRVPAHICKLHRDLRREQNFDCFM